MQFQGVENPLLYLVAKTAFRPCLLKPRNEIHITSGRTKWFLFQIGPIDRFRTNFIRRIQQCVIKSLTWMNLGTNCASTEAIEDSYSMYPIEPRRGL